MGIYEKALEIKAQLDTLKTNLGLSADTPLTDVVNTASSGGTPTTGDIYKVKTIAERDALTGVPQNAICVVIDKSQGALTEDAVFTKVSFSSSVTLPTAIEDYLDASFRSDDGMIDFMCSLNSSGMNIMIYDMNAGDMTSIRYRSSNGITFTLSGPVTEVELSSPVSCQTGWDDRFGLFMTTTAESFDGIFIREESSWVPAYVGATATEQDIFAPSTALTNSGKITGGLNKDKWSKHSIYVQEEEPTDTEIDRNAIWIVPSSNVSASEKEYLNTKQGDIKFTSTDITKKAQVNLVGDNTYKFNPSGSGKQLGDCVSYDYVYLTVNSESSNASDTRAVTYNGETYVLTCPYNSSLTRFGKLNKTLDSYTELATPTLPGEGRIVGNPVCDGTYVYVLYRVTSNASLYSLLYTIDSGTWGSRQLKSSTRGISYEYPLIPTNTLRGLMISKNGSIIFEDINFSSGRVYHTYEISEADLTTNEFQALASTLENFIFKREGNYLYSFDGLVELNLGNLSKENILAAFEPYYRTSNRFDSIFTAARIGYENMMFTSSLGFSYNLIVDGNPQRLLITGNDGRIDIEPLFIADDVLYLYGDDWKIYSMSLTQELPIVPGTYGILFQTGSSKHRVTLCEGIETDFVNVALITNYYYNNDNMGVDKVYIRKLNYSTYEYEWVEVLNYTTTE